MTPISSISLSPLPPSLAAVQPPGTQAGASATQPFKNILLEAIGQVNSMQTEANQAVEQLITGGDVNPAEVLTSLQKADISFRMMMQIRNKLVQAYQEVNNIRI